MNEASRTCGCGCGEKFTPVKPWQRFKSEACRNRYHGARRDRLRKVEAEMLAKAERARFKLAEADAAVADFVDTLKGDGK